MVMSEKTMQESVTEVTRARMTVGESRGRIGEGRVKGER